jgi:hypothetical protein
MKHLLWISLFLLAALSCKNDGSNTSGTSGAAAPGTVVTTEPEGGFVPPLNPGSSPLVTLLTTEYWVFEFYVVDNAAARQFNRGRWLKFSPDGTFINGHWGEQTGYGSWRLEEEEDKVILHLDNIYDSQDVQYEVQGISQEQDTMTWVGVNRTPSAGAIIKVINLSSRPTKAQFGIEG